MPLSKSTPGIVDASAMATPSTVLWSSFRTITRQASPVPEPVLWRSRSFGGVSVAVTLPSSLGLKGSDDRLGDHYERPAGNLTRLAEARERVGLGELLLLHQQPLRALDRLARDERLLQRVRLGAHREQLLVACPRRLDRGNDVLLAERLHEVAVHADLGRTLDELALVEGGQHHDRDRPLLDDPPRRLDPVEPRHLDVHHGEVGLELAREADGFLAVARLADHLVAGP